MGEELFMWKDCGMMWMNETEIKTPAAKLIKYAMLAIPHFSYFRMIYIPILVTRQAIKLARMTIPNMSLFIASIYSLPVF
jgi:hypothetical protein